MYLLGLPDWLRKNALIAIMLLATALAFLSLAISVFVFRAQGERTEEMLASYVSDLADTFVENRTAMAESARMRAMPGAAERRYMPRRRIFFRMFSADPSIRSGGVLLLDRAYRPIGGSEGAEALIALWRDDLPLDGVSKVADASGTEYQVAVRALSSGNRILVAASRANLLVSMTHLWNIWIVSLMSLSVAILACTVALWRFLVLPMRRVVEGIGATNWGRERPNFGKPWLYEVRALTDVVEQSAENAIAKEELRARYVGDIVRAQENVRRRFSRELHDGPLQAVVAAIKRIQLAQLTQNTDTENDAKARERLGEAERISQAAADELRNFCEELSPSWMALGVGDALDALAERLETAHGVQIDVQVDERREDRSDEYTLALIRITQEAVSNAVRHGGATRIEVQLKGSGKSSGKDSGKSSVFTIADDGLGFATPPPADYESLRVEGHRGLSNMHERAQLLGGNLTILPYGIDGGQGTTIEVTLPNCG